MCRRPSWNTCCWAAWPDMPGADAALFAVRFHDRADQLPVRQAQMQAHLAWLESHQDQVLVAGSLRTVPETPAVGALWVVRADNRAAVQALVETDPFWLHGLRASCEILHWFKAFPDRTTPV